MNTHQTFIDELFLVISTSLANRSRTEFDQLVEPLLQQHFPPVTNDITIDPLQMLLCQLQQSALSQASGGVTVQSRGPKKGAISTYEVYLKEHGNWTQWKLDHPGKHYSIFQKQMKPVWDQVQQNQPGIAAAIKAKRNSFLAWREEHPTKKYSDYLKIAH